MGYIKNVFVRTSFLITFTIILIIPFFSGLTYGASVNKESAVEVGKLFLSQKTARNPNLINPLESYDFYAVDQDIRSVRVIKNESGDTLAYILKIGFTRYISSRYYSWDRKERYYRTSLKLKYL